MRRLLGPSLREYLRVPARRDVTAPIVANLAAACARIGRNVLIVDETPGEIAAALGLAARRDLAHALDSDRRLDRTVLTAEQGLAVLPATRGLERAVDKRIALSSIVDRCAPSPDLVLVHAYPALLAELRLPAGAHMLLPVTASSSALASAYAEVKRTVRRGSRVRAFVHGAATQEGARALVSGLADIARQFLAADIDYAGFVPADPALYRAVATRRSVFDVDPASPAARALELVASALGERRPALVH